MSDIAERVKKIVIEGYKKILSDFLCIDIDNLVF